jgi:hypothetical protein
MHDLVDFSLSDMAECAARVRRLGHGASTMEEAAGRIVTYLYDDLADHRSGQRACALVRFYKTHPYGLLDAGRRRFAFRRAAAGEEASPDARYIALLATTGDEPAWRSVAGSQGHQAIPLDTAESAARVPMVHCLFDQLGLDFRASPPTSSSVAVDARPPHEARRRSAASCTDVPVQEPFVSRHGIRSVLGFGGQLPAGDLFAVVLFTRVPIEAGARALFKTLALAVKVSLVAFAHGPFFS